jgi:hypothetical protein
LFFSELRSYQISHFLSGGRTIGSPALHEKAFWNSGMFDSTPLTRYLFDEWGLVAALSRSASGRAFSH